MIRVTKMETPMLRSLKRLLPRQAGQTLPTARTRLRLEALEGREVPSAAGLDGRAARPLYTAPLAYNGTVVGLTPAQVRHAYGVDQTRVYHNGGFVAPDGQG